MARWIARRLPRAPPNRSRGTGHTATSVSRARSARFAANGLYRARAVMRTMCSIVSCPRSECIPHAAAESSLLNLLSCRARHSSCGERFYTRHPKLCGEGKHPAVGQREAHIPSAGRRPALTQQPSRGVGGRHAGDGAIRRRLFWLLRGAR